ncbi:MAG: hypothetical protein ACYTGN_16165 [Planctomycetota bacterium]|jgi:hypothetical protein
MRALAIFAFLLVSAACSSTPAGEGQGEAKKPLPQTQVIFRQYYKGSPIFIVENLAGRDQVKLRSKPAKHGEIKPAYVPDDVMERMLTEFKDFGYFRHAGARPRDPRTVGGRAEITIIGADKSMVSFVRRNGQGKDAYETYKNCVDTFRVVHAHYGKFQAASGGAEFGVKKVEFDR